MSKKQDTEQVIQDSVNTDEADVVQQVPSQSEPAVDLNAGRGGSYIRQKDGTRVLKSRTERRR